MDVIPNSTINKEHRGTLRRRTARSLVFSTLTRNAKFHIPVEGPQSIIDFQDPNYSLQLKRVMVAGASVTAALGIGARLAGLI